MPLLETIASGAARAFGLTSFSRLLDQLFKRTTLLVSGNGTNATANTAFTDYSSDNVSLTRINNTSPGAFHPFAYNYSVYYDGSSYSQVAQGSAFQFGTGEFSIEFWVNVANDVNIQSYWTAMASVGGVGYSQNGVAIYLMDNGYGTVGGIAVDMNNGGGGLRLTDTIDIRGTGWRHIAVTRDSSSTVRLFLDGQLRQSGTSTLNINGSGTYGAVIGISDSGQANYFKGHISNFRVVKGSSVYTSNFTPSATKLTAITNTSFLANTTNRWTQDVSSNNLTIFAGAGNPKVEVESPFVSLEDYLTTQGASYYFDGSGDAIQLGNNAVENPAFFSWLNTTGGSRTGTIEAWVYPIAFGIDTTDYEHSSFLNKGQVFFNFGVRGRSSGGGVLGTPRFYWYGAGNQRWIQSSTTIKLNEWSHIAAVLDGSTVKLYINGVNSGGTRYTDATLSETFAAGQGGSFNGVNDGGFANSTEFYVGRVSNASITAAHWNGYVSNLRIVPGTQVYTSNFTPPSAPLTNISGTKLLLTGQHTAITDATTKHNIETYGNAQISTSAIKYGTGSIYFDGSGDALIAKNPLSPALKDIGTGNFTIEGWFYPTTWTTGEVIFRRLFAIGTSLSNDISLNLDNSGSIVYRNNDVVLITSSSPLPLNTWSHVALVRNSGTTTIYLNGTSVGTTSTNNNLSTAANNPVYIGNHPNLNGTFQGYIDDFRISKIARYTSNFTVPSEFARS